MSAPKTFENDTWLYHAAHGARLFLASQEQPGEGWFDHPQSPVEVPAAGPTADRLAELEGELTDQRGKFDAAWADLTKAKKVVEDDLAKRQAELATADGLITKQAGTIEARDKEIAELKATIAKFDPDGDGKPGGSVAKASK